MPVPLTITLQAAGSVLGGALVSGPRNALLAALELMQVGRGAPPACVIGGYQGGLACRDAYLLEPHSCACTLHHAAA